MSYISSNADSDTARNFDFDLFVIGAGSGGVRLARMSAAMGARFAVAEDRYLGGTCVNVGCVPKKLFVYASHVREELEDGQGFGWTNDGDLKFDWPSLVNRKNQEISRLNGIYKNLLENSGAAIINGTAKVIEPHVVEVDGSKYSAERIVVATGGWPRKLNIPGAEHIITSNEFFFLEALPKRAVVQGGGYIAIELAGILNGLGVETHIVFRGEKLLKGFDEEVRDFVSEQVQKKGITLHPRHNVDSVIKLDNGSFEVFLTNNHCLETDLVLSALGRVPKVGGLGLDEVGVECHPNGAVVVNDDFQTSVRSIYAIGDVIDRVQLTPVALEEGMYLANLFFADEKPSKIDYENIPTAVFCQPNIGTVGLTEEEARTRFPNIDVYASSFKPMKHTMSGRDERSLMKLVVDKESDKVLGAHMVGPDAGEIIQGLGIAIKVGATKPQFDQTIGIHPTAAEEFVTMRTPTPRT